jgi:hypothetical protein
MKYLIVMLVLVAVSMAIVLQYDDGVFEYVYTGVDYPLGVWFDVTDFRLSDYGLSFHISQIDVLAYSMGGGKPVTIEVWAGDSSGPTYQLWAGTHLGDVYGLWTYTFKLDLLIAGSFSQCDFWVIYNQNGKYLAYDSESTVPCHSFIYRFGGWQEGSEYYEVGDFAIRVHGDSYYEDLSSSTWASIKSAF